MTNTKHVHNSDDSMIIRLKRPGVVEKKAEPMPEIPKVEMKKVIAPRVSKRLEISEHISPLMIAVFCAIGLGIIGGAGMFWYAHSHTSSVLQPTPVASQQSATSSPTAVTEIVRKVGRLMALPTGEEPTLAMVSNVDSLKDQIFFKQAKNGDFVLMYAKAQRAILYDAIGDKILEVGPIVDAPVTP